VSRWFRSYGYADVLDGLLVGAYPLDGDDVTALARLGIQRVLNLADETEYRPGERDAVQRAMDAAGIDEYRLVLDDYGTLPPEAIETAVQALNTWLDEGTRIYLHCRAGWQRSAAIAAGVIAVRTGTDIDDALAYVQERKPNADPLPHQREDLRRWWEARAIGRTDGEGPAG
jgi:protein-tyrosine phosphatase